MTLEDRLQGEWLCCVDDQCLEGAWTIAIRGQQCDFEGKIGTLLFEDDEATMALGGGTQLVINRRWSDDDRNHELPVVIAGNDGGLQRGWMFRPGMVTADA